MTVRTQINQLHGLFANGTLKDPWAIVADAGNGDQVVAVCHSENLAENVAHLVEMEDLRLYTASLLERMVKADMFQPDLVLEADVESIVTRLRIDVVDDQRREHLKKMCAEAGVPGPRQMIEAIKKSPHQKPPDFEIHDPELPTKDVKTGFEDLDAKSFRNPSTTEHFKVPPAENAKLPTKGDSCSLPSEAAHAVDNGHDLGCAKTLDPEANCTCDFDEDAQ